MSSIKTTEDDKKGMVEGNDEFLKLIEKMFQSENEYRRLLLEQRVLQLTENHLRNVKTFIKDNMTLEQQNQTLKQNKKDLENELDKLKNEDVDQKRCEIVDLMAEESCLKIKLELLRAGYDEEFKKLESQVQNETRVIHDSDKRSLDLEPIIESLEAHYTEITERAKEEAEQLNQKKMKAVVQIAGQREQEVRIIEKEITVLTQSISELKRKLEEIQKEETTLKNNLPKKGREDDAESTVNDIIELEGKLNKKKENLAEEVRKQQQLLNIKLCLDIEIATYRELLKNEEERMRNSTTDQATGLQKEPQIHRSLIWRRMRMISDRDRKPHTSTFKPKDT